MRLLADSNNLDIRRVSLFLYVLSVNNDVIAQRSASLYMRQNKLKILVRMYLML